MKTKNVGTAKTLNLSTTPNDPLSPRGQRPPLYQSITHLVALVFSLCSLELTGILTPSPLLQYLPNIGLTRASVWQHGFQGVKLGGIHTTIAVKGTQSLCGSPYCCPADYRTSIHIFALRLD